MRRVHYTIYALVDPRTKLVCYVGNTVQPLKTRLCCHVSSRDIERSPKAAWIRSLVALGLRPSIKALQGTYDRLHATALETRFIRKFLGQKQFTNARVRGHARKLSDKPPLAVLNIRVPRSLFDLLEKRAALVSKKIGVGVHVTAGHMMRIILEKHA